MNNYFVFTEDSPFIKMKWEEFITHCRGILIISIGAGNFKETADMIMRMSAGWALHHQNDEGSK